MPAAVDAAPVARFRPFSNLFASSHARSTCVSWPGKYYIGLTCWLPTGFIRYDGMLKIRLKRQSIKRANEDQENRLQSITTYLSRNVRSVAKLLPFPHLHPHHADRPSSLAPNEQLKRSVSSFSHGVGIGQSTFSGMAGPFIRAFGARREQYSRIHTSLPTLSCSG